MFGSSEKLGKCHNGAHWFSNPHSRTRAIIQFNIHHGGLQKAPQRTVHTPMRHEGGFKNEHIDLRAVKFSLLSINYTPFNIWVRYFVSNFKVYL